MFMFWLGLSTPVIGSEVYFDVHYNGLVPLGQVDKVWDGSSYACMKYDWLLAAKTGNHISME
jgi:hypothetical protein